MGRPTVAEINLEHLEHNLKCLRGHLRSSTRVLAIVKADAYGHGAARVASRLKMCGVSHFGVATVEEGEELRKEGLSAPILVMGGILPDQIAEAVELDLETVVASKDHLDTIIREGELLKKEVFIHIKVDTGMGRLGIFPDQLRGAMAQVEQSGYVCVKGVMSHLASADGDCSEDMEYTRQQLGEVTETLNSFSGDSLPLHVLNSAGIFRFPDFQFQMVRPGISLYGSRPNAEFEEVGILPVMTLLTKIYYIKDFHRGHGVSYGRRYVTGGKERIAVLPIGYADGMRRMLYPGHEVLVEGKAAPVVGTICMDNTMVDVTDIPEAMVGSEVMIFGKRWGRTSPVEEVAKRAQTIPYAILTGIGKRVPRVYIG